MSAPFVGQKKLTLGSKRLHTPLDVEALKQRKTITLLGRRGGWLTGCLSVFCLLYVRLCVFYLLCIWHCICV